MVGSIEQQPNERENPSPAPILKSYTPPLQGNQHDRNHQGSSGPQALVLLHSTPGGYGRVCTSGRLPGQDDHAGRSTGELYPQVGHEAGISTAGGDERGSCVAQNTFLSKLTPDNFPDTREGFEALNTQFKSEKYERPRRQLNYSTIVTLGFLALIVLHELWQKWSAK